MAEDGAGERFRDPIDVDEDGYSVVHDCDDASSAVFPGAPEVCNGVDDDCDGTVDVGAADVATWYPDIDGDGYGADGATSACSAPADHVSRSGDCDDANAEIHPGGVERCGGSDEDCDGRTDDADATGASAWFADADSDGHGDPDRVVTACEAPPGHVGVGDDCDDADGDVHPGEAEACDGVDQDCDGEADEGAFFALYADADGDGWGRADVTLAACPVPDGWSLAAGDCDDSDPAASPGGVEVCDAADQDEDCDGYADDADVDAAGVSWFPDGDGDGFGDPGAGVVACDAPGGYLSDGSDCDDAEPWVNPSAIEVCNGADDDCDGSTDASDAADASTWYADADGDGYGDPDAAVSACDAPAGHVADDSDCADADAVRSPGGTETCEDGLDDDCDGIDTVCGRFSGTYSIDAAAALALEGQTGGDLAGWSVAFAGDLDGDGRDDVFVGAPESDATGDASGGQGGAVYGFYMNGTHSGAESVTWADIELTGHVATRSGLAVAPGGDLFGDGRPWVLVGSMGTAYAVPAPSSMGLGATLSAGGLICANYADDDLTGWAVAGLDDADGDGMDDWVVGAPYNDEAGDAAGKVYIGCETTFTLSTMLYWWAGSYTGEDAGDHAGSALSEAGDVDGDGLGDLLVGAPYRAEAGVAAGKVYLVLGGASPGDRSLASADASWVGVAAGDLAGVALWGGGDVDGDGYGDLAVGSGGAGAWVVFGPPAVGAGSLADADLWIRAEAAGEAAGADVSGGADVDGDGVPDLVVSAPGSGRAAAGGGAVYVLAGPLSAGSVDLEASSAFLVLDEADGAAGWSVDATGDADGDGVADMLVGAPGISAEAGGAFLLLGGP